MNYSLCVQLHKIAKRFLIPIPLSSMWKIFHIRPAGGVVDYYEVCFNIVLIFGKEVCFCLSQRIFAVGMSVARGLPLETLSWTKSPF